MDLANLSDEEIRAVMALGRLCHERRHYAQSVVEVETAVGALPETEEKTRVIAEIAKEPQKQAEALAEVRAIEAKRKADAELMAAAQAEAKTRKVGN